MNFILMLAAFAFWAAHFMLVYGYAGLICARPDWAHVELLGISLLTIGILLADFVALGLLAGIAAISRSPALAPEEGGSIERERLVRFVTLGGVIVAALAILWETLSLVTQPPCR
jgi:hypothetical protein